MKSTIRKILCPIDFSEDSFAALRAAYTLALCFSAQLVALTVMPNLSNLRLQGGRPVHHRIAESYFGEQLDLAVKQWTEGDARIESMVINGYAPEEILRVADNLKVDAIIMAEERKDDWEKIRDGSVSEEVAVQANCPVLILRTMES